MPHQSSLSFNTFSNISSPEGNIVTVQNRSKRGRKSKYRETQPLRTIRLSRGYTLEELSEITKMSPSYISRLESGTRRLNADSIKKLAGALLCNPNDLLSSQNKWSEVKGFFEASNTYNIIDGKLAKNPEPLSDSIVLYNSTNSDGIIDFSNTNQMVSCPSELAGTPGAFAYMVNDNSMTPKYHNGAIVHVHPGNPLTPGAYAFLITTEGKAMIGEFVRWSSTNDNRLNAANDCGLPELYFLEIKQYNPSRMIKFTQSDILSVGRIISSVERA
jgi:transcriptional regulator with XRE-family HTH domain